MRIDVRENLYKDPNNLKFLREHSVWYKNLNRDGSKLNEMNEVMKEMYGLRFRDKVDKAKTGLDLISAFLNVTDGD